MKPIQFFFLFVLLIFFQHTVNAQENPKPIKSDSITLAQAYINLTLTKEYFGTLSEDRISKIISFEMDELGSITNRTFLRDNFALYNFSYSLLYYNKAKFLFGTRNTLEREELIGWNTSLEKAIEHFNKAKKSSSWGIENPFFELIKYEEESYKVLHREIFELKSLLTPYFNEDIYPDFKRIFLKAKNTDHFETDSLIYFSNLYSLEFNTAISDKEYNLINYDYGPNTLAIGSEYNHIERDYDYHPSEPLEISYLLDERLDLISKYVQLKSLASATNTDSLSWFESYRLFNSYYIFKDQTLDNLFFNKITEEEDTFLKTELDQKEYELLYSSLRKKFSYESYATAQAFINLSLIQSNFETQSSSQIATSLSFHERELGEVKNANFKTQNAKLYNFTYSLLYENTARLLYRSRKNINRKVLVNWKEMLEKGIEYYTISNQERVANSQFNELIKFDEDDVSQLRKNINHLKLDFTPYFNDDIYPDFQRIFYKAKKSEEYDFEALKEFAGIYNINIDFNILKSKQQTSTISPFNSISKEYRLEMKLSLISRYLELKYVASDQFISRPRRFNVESLYNSYYNFLNDLEKEEDDFIKRELNELTINQLYKELQAKFPYQKTISFRQDVIAKSLIDSDGDGIGDSQEVMPELNFFPELAPLASASFIKRNFKPELKTLGKVDDFLRKEFIGSGYKDQLQYYYSSDGFAITTSLERFTSDGSRVDPEKRFVKSLTSEQKLSYYEIFKSMFMDLEFDYRMFALTISSKATQMSKDGMTPSFAEKLIENSFSSLPADLRNKELSNKILSVFVYHFRLNINNGTVELDLTGKRSAQDYLKEAGLIKIIQ